MAAVLATLGGLAAALLVLRLMPPGPVAVAVPADALPAEAAAGPCGALAEALPQTLGGEDRRGTTPEDPRVAAWVGPACSWCAGSPSPSRRASAPR